MKKLRIDWIAMAVAFRQTGMSLTNFYKSPMFCQFCTHQTPSRSSFSRCMSQVLASLDAMQKIDERTDITSDEITSLETVTAKSLRVEDFDDAELNELTVVHNPKISFQKSYASFHLFDGKRFAENRINVLHFGIVASKERAEVANPAKLAVGEVRPLRLLDHNYSFSRPSVLIVSRY